MIDDRRFLLWNILLPLGVVVLLGYFAYGFGYRTFHVFAETISIVIGGTAMKGGRFSLLASMVGALVMQAITQSMYAIGVPAFALQAIKAVVVILVIVSVAKLVVP